MTYKEHNAPTSNLLKKLLTRTRWDLLGLTGLGGLGQLGTAPGLKGSRMDTCNNILIFCSIKKKCNSRRFFSFIPSVRVQTGRSEVPPTASIWLGWSLSVGFHLRTSKRSLLLLPTPPPSSLSNFPTLPQSSPLTMNNLSGGKKKFNKLLITATAGLDWTKDVLVAVWNNFYWSDGVRKTHEDKINWDLS